jgi:predicted XRE-type DNA-binding protein
MKTFNQIIQVPTSSSEEGIFRKITNDEYLSNWIPAVNATALEKIKYQISQVITRSLIKDNLTEEQIANKLDLDKFTTARLVRGYTEPFSLDSLVNYLDKLQLNISSLIVAQEEVRTV